MKNHWLKKKEDKRIWDFKIALSETIKEKYESLYVKVVEVNDVVLRKTLKGNK